MRVSLFVLLLAGCGPAPNHVRENYEADSKRITIDMRKQLVAPLCRGDVEGLKACGLIVYEFRKPAQQAIFAAKTCPGVEVTQDRACFDAYAGAFIRELAARYDRADAHEIDVACSSTANCSKWEEMELAWLESHNEHVFAEARKAMASLNERTQHQQEAIDRERTQWAAVAAGLAGAAKGMNDAMHPPARSCMASNECDPGAVCIGAQGATRGTCMTAR